MSTFNSGCLTSEAATSSSVCLAGNVNSAELNSKSTARTTSVCSMIRQLASTWKPAGATQVGGGAGGGGGSGSGGGGGGSARATVGGGGVGAPNINCKPTPKITSPGLFGTNGVFLMNSYRYLASVRSCSRVAPDWLPRRVNSPIPPSANHAVLLLEWRPRLSVMPPAPTNRNGRNVEVTGRNL